MNEEKGTDDEVIFLLYKFRYVKFEMF
jgi:hypothetical protein